MKPSAITLIGMPGAGKSTVGKELAQKLVWNLVDLDLYIRAKQGMTHTRYLQQYGGAALSQLEEEYASTIPLEQTVFAPGGSMVYAEKAMDRLSRESAIVFLRVDLGVIESRLGDAMSERGIIGFEEKGIAGIYDERLPLYEKYADIHVDASGDSPSVIADAIISLLFQSS